MSLMCKKHKKGLNNKMTNKMTNRGNLKPTLVAEVGQKKAEERKGTSRNKSSDSLS